MLYRFFACLIALQVLILVMLVAAGHFSADRMAPVRHCNRQLVRCLGLTDLSLWTGARYTRHLSQADFFSAFQDGMGALEHFPEGALVPLPTLARRPSTIEQRKDVDESAF